MRSIRSNSLSFSVGLTLKHDVKAENKSDASKDSSSLKLIVEYCLQIAKIIKKICSSPEFLAIITGGNFGPEGSIQATLFCFIATIILLFLSHKKSRIIKPFWK